MGGYKKMTKTKRNIRNKVLLMLWALLTVGLLVMTASQFFSNAKNGDQSIREKLLVSATITVMQDESVELEDIENVQVAKMKAGVFPFNYSVLVDLKNGEQLTIQWKDETMTDSEIVNQNR
jgi:hypothetical protein